MGIHSGASTRHGAVLVLTAAMLVVLMAMTALAIDYGYLLVVRTQLQVAVDSAALAGVMELIDDEAVTGQPDMTDEIAAARAKAVEYAARHKADAHAVVVQSNGANDPAGDVVVGYLADPTDLNGTMQLDSLEPPNSVRVTARLERSRGNPVALFFARMLGFDAANVSATATASMISEIRGLTTSPASGTANVVPFAIWVETWNQAYEQGIGPDDYAYDEQTGVTAGADDVPELSLYPLFLFPNTKTGDDYGIIEPNPAGNFGTVDIGSPSNSTQDIARQILEGPNEEDLSYHGGTLDMGAEGYIDLQGDPGLSVGFKDEWASIIGLTRTILLYETVSIEGNNATYRIVGFVGIRVMDVIMTGALTQRRIVVQPADVRGGFGTIADPGDGVSELVHLSPILVR